MKNVQNMARFFALLLTVVVANDHAKAMLVELKGEVSANTAVWQHCTVPAPHTTTPESVPPLSAFVGLLESKGFTLLSGDTGRAADVESRIMPTRDTGPTTPPSSMLRETFHTEGVPYLRPDSMKVAPIFTEKFQRRTFSSVDMDWNVAADRAHGDTQGWLFLLQYTELETGPAPGNAPLIPIPEPNTASLVFCGIVGLAFRKLVIPGR